MSSPDPSPRGRYDYLEGLRGLAALYVVFYHVWQSLTVRSPRSAAVDWALGWAASGVPAVAVFITLSGFLLTLPVARTGTLAGGLRGFAARRARRILPPYFAALALGALLVQGLLPGLLDTPDVYTRALPADEVRENLVAHALLVHNLSRDAIYSLNGPLWSVATECQIYAAFALVMVPIRRAAGPLAAALGGLGLAGAAAAVPAQWVPPGACLWMVGCFALGSLGAEVAEGPCRRALARGPWGAAALAALLGVMWVGAEATGHVHHFDRVAKWCALASAGTAGLLLAARRGDRWALGVAEFLGRAGPARLGAMSYSLYLTHGPVLGVADALLRRSGLAPAERLPLMVGAAVPACLAVAWGFHWAFERPTLAPRRAAP